MSRMDRYKKIHEESQKSEQKKGIPVRKERKSDYRNNYQENHLVDDYESHHQSSQYQPESPLSSPDKRKNRLAFSKLFHKRNRDRPRSSFKKKFALIFILFIVLEIGSFFLGKVQAETDSSIPQQELEGFNGVTGANGANNILLLGSDSREGETARADTIMLLSLDNPERKPKLVSFMRDTLVNIPGIGYNKINAAYAYGGADLLRQTIELNFGVSCRYYAIVDFQSFEKVIDALFSSGVKIDAEKDLDLDGVFIKQGSQRMDGHTLLQYARFRMDEEGDFGRVRRQQQVMSAIFSQMKNPLTVLRLPYAAGKVLGYTSTDIPMTFLMGNALTIAKGSSGIERLTVPVENSWYFDDYGDAGSVLNIDEGMNQQAVQSFLQE